MSIWRRVRPPATTTNTRCCAPRSRSPNGVEPDRRNFTIRWSSSVRSPRVSRRLSFCEISLPCPERTCNRLSSGRRPVIPTSTGPRWLSSNPPLVTAPPGLPRSPQRGRPLLRRHNSYQPLTAMKRFVRSCARSWRRQSGAFGSTGWPSLCRRRRPTCARFVNNSNVPVSHLLGPSTEPLEMAWSGASSTPSWVWSTRRRLRRRRSGSPERLFWRWSTPRHFEGPMARCFGRGLGRTSHDPQVLLRGWMVGRRRSTCTSSPSSNASKRTRPLRRPLSEIFGTSNAPPLRYATLSPGSGSSHLQQRSGVPGPNALNGCDQPSLSCCLPTTGEVGGPSPKSMLRSESTRY